VLQAIFRRHYAAFAKSYPSRYACHYGRFRLARITKVSKAFIRCGDCPSGGSAVAPGDIFGRAADGESPECRSELFRPFACRGFHL
jgi:hypothetical protein